MGLYIQVHSMHGLVRSVNLELGRDEDTGGQILYIKYLAAELGMLPEVDRVDVITRRIIDVDYPGYSDLVEPITSKAHIVRIECGPKRYIKKVNLWPYMEEYTNNCLKYIKKLGRIPDILHSNYADAGLVCTRLAKILAIPQVHTGHSLGKPKMARLGVTDQNFSEFDRIYHFSERFKAEQEAIDNAAAIIVSTDEERLHQYNLYNVDISDSRFHIIPPGLNSLKIYPPAEENRTAENLVARGRILSLINQALAEPAKPMVFTISRLDYRKNLTSLVKAYAFDRELQTMANLVIVTGSLGKMGKHEQLLMQEMQSIVDAYNLTDKVCIIKHLEYETQVGEMYRVVHDYRGVFVNPAFHEPFGITILEAAATGIPIVATNNGGPVEILAKCDCGLLIDPRDTKAIARACKKILNGNDQWSMYAQNGLKNVPAYYSWANTARKELQIFLNILGNRTVTLT
ncbi:MAG: glycosyltransferase [Desulforhopalus sp.]|nr:glycosyltransferase [Desulforhopalus sp.]